MKTLKYKPYQGLQIVCKAKNCGAAIHVNNKPYRGCNHPIEKQRYKAVLINPFTGKKQTRDLVSRNYDEAILELLKFKDELHNPMVIAPVKVDEKPLLFIDCVSNYLNWLENIDVPAQFQRKRTDKHIKSSQRYLEKFTEFLKDKKFNLKTFKITEIDDKVVGWYFEKVTSKTSSPSTFNHIFGVLKSFFKFLVKIKKYQIYNPFELIQMRNIRINNPESISSEEFFKLLDGINNNNNVKKYVYKEKNGEERVENKNQYYTWLKDIIELGAYTGRRRSELINMKFSMIKTDENGVPIYIEAPDIKVNKLKNNTDEKRQKLVFIPMIKELKDLLNRLGYEENKNTDNFIIAPNITIERSSMELLASKSFSYFWKKVNSKKEIGFKHLRKTYVTLLGNYQKIDEIGLITGQTKNVIEDFYKNHRIFATGLSRSDFYIFSPSEKLQKVS